MGDLKLSTNFECGAGVVRAVGDGGFLLETVADRYGYDRYFCVRIDNSKSETATPLRLTVMPGTGSGVFMTHFPSHLWYCRKDATRWMPVRNTWEDAVTFHGDRIEIELEIEAGGVMTLATNVPIAYSELMLWMAKIAVKARCGAVGQSFEGREIPVVRLGTEGKPRLLVVGGMHSSEHCGVFASMGIVDWLTSRVREAKAVRGAFDIAVIPMLNPDGNVHGYSGTTAEQLEVNQSLDFVGAAEGKPMRTHENRVLWAWMEERFQPNALLHFHGYMGWKRNGDFPYDGIYVISDPSSVFTNKKSVEMQEAIVDRVRFETDGFTAHCNLMGGISEGMLEYQLARKWQTVSLLYEINVGSVGPGRQYQRGVEVLGAVVRGIGDVG